eukprot:TRINITY_DN8831_c0_g1_i1.p1 TRINITY_DN8831_c0_g1~~TRINITY_DN8831_c0_g1_i1.p1  ORF type:complete len:240 (-),score=37.53 TRINITY_DN8831_c0_g1_i1:152-790(-)
MEEPQVSVLLMGDMGVGKTSTAVRFTRVTKGEEGAYLADPCENSFKYRVSIDGGVVVVDVVDTIGRYNMYFHGEDSETFNWYNADGYVMLYSICDAKSFQYVKTFPSAICKREDHFERRKQRSARNIEDIPLLLVGNKVDLVSPGNQNGTREVSTEEGKRVAKDLGCCGFFEISARTNENIDDAFICLIRHILEKRGIRLVGEEKEGLCVLQ